MTFELPSLEYGYGALEPWIDVETMKIHHDKHHRAYTDKFNAALEEYPEFFEKNPQEILANLDEVPEDVRTAVKNNGRGYVNHLLFWEILGRDKELNGKLKEAIEEGFGGFDKFKDKFSSAAATLFGSGWAWLVVSDGKLEIVSTANQDTPLSEGKKPVLCVDV